ncbi:phage tail protein [Salmonella enterica subsp. enterica serovar Mountpleasant]|nr:phage tail protein [Salmonella enterica subsp. enterica serovar Mountpleasant]
MKTFRWIPRPGMGIKTKPTAKVVKFGDGCEQRSPGGLHDQLRSFSPTFRVTNDELPYLLAFLKEHGSHRAFLWRPAVVNQQIKVVCREWDVKAQNLYADVSCQFDEVVA